VIVYPAIDIRGGRCVRLIEGDFSRETIFDADPADAAMRWEAAGAAWIHVVDLDGAVAGRPVNLGAIGRIRAAVGAKIQLGGGLRDLIALASAFDSGVDRAVLGTAAAQDEATVRAAVDRWPGRVAAGLDARDGKLATRGWLEQTEIGVDTAASRLRELGVETLIFTDIRRDGTLRGPNLDALKSLASKWGASGLIASGGVGTMDDLVALRNVGVGGAIVGRALYDGRVDLSEAIALSGKETVG
jgi:phosphoribosylformimino-5-aminoimidazole carboxamide ribotide isomerase